MKRTGLETFLLLWLAISLMTAISMFAFSGGRIIVSGTAWQALLALVVAGCLWCYLFFRMWRPTMAGLLLGMALCIWGAIRIQWPGGRWSSYLGFAVYIRLTNDPNLIVSIDLVQSLMAILFVVALFNRVSVRQAASHNSE